MPKRKVAVVGGGVGGLAAAWQLAKAGHRVTVFEREPQLGGLASAFRLGDELVERFYHFICTPDEEYFLHLQELGLSNRLRWKICRMGLYYQGRLHRFGAPWDLLSFPGLSLRGKAHFARGLSACKRLSFENWQRIEAIPASTWLIREFGEEAYRIIHEPLLRLKFGVYAETLSAAWMWARIHRVGKSRTRWLKRELLGYLEGGSQALIDALSRQITRLGGELRPSTTVTQIEIAEGRAAGVRRETDFESFDCVLSAIPLPILSRLLPTGLPDALERVRRTESIGVMCLSIRLPRSLSRHLWINISDPDIHLAGIVEYTNLNPMPGLGGDSLVYLPQYLPSRDPRWSRPQEEIEDELFAYLERIFPHFRRSQVRQSHLHREEFAQPLCKIGFPALIPEIRTPIRGLYVIDSFQLHPDDRTISNSLGLGRQAARTILRDCDES